MSELNRLKETGLYVDQRNNCLGRALGNGLSLALCLGGLSRLGMRFVKTFGYVNVSYVYPAE
jgi:hypothetical protein